MARPIEFQDLKITSVSIPRSLYDRVKQMAKDRDTSVSALMRDIFIDAMMDEADSQNTKSKKEKKQFSVPQPLLNRAADLLSNIVSNGNMDQAERVAERQVNRMKNFDNSITKQDLLNFVLRC